MYMGNSQIACVVIGVILCYPRDGGVLVLAGEHGILRMSNCSLDGIMLFYIVPCLSDNIVETLRIWRGTDHGEISIADRK